LDHVQRGEHDHFESGLPVLVALAHECPRRRSINIGHQYRYRPEVRSRLLKKARTLCWLAYIGLHKMCLSSQCCYRDKPSFPIATIYDDTHSFGG
jgi:hypothetical protein